MATNFSPSYGSYVLNQFPSIVMYGMKGFYVSASGAIQGHHGPFILDSNRSCIIHISVTITGLDMYHSVLRRILGPELPIRSHSTRGVTVLHQRSRYLSWKVIVRLIKLSPRIPVPTNKRQRRL